MLACMASCITGRGKRNTKTYRVRRLESPRQTDGREMGRRAFRATHSGPLSKYSFRQFSRYLPMGDGTFSVCRRLARNLEAPVCTTASRSLNTTHFKFSLMGDEMSRPRGGVRSFRVRVDCFSLFVLDITFSGRAVLNQKGVL